MLHGHNDGIAELDRYDRMPKRFFLTYSLKDQSLVLRVGRALSTFGYNVWIDKFKIKAGDSLIRKIFDEGLQRTDYLCAFLTPHSIRSKWVREELEFAFHRSVVEQKPKIVMLQFENAKIPVFLRHRHYATLSSSEIGEIVRTILASANLPSMTSFTEARPFATLAYHDAVRQGNVTFVLASRKDQLEIEPYSDMEGIVFNDRHIFIIRIDSGARKTTFHYMNKARIAHTAMRIIDDTLLVFLNVKLENSSFAMTGFLYRFKKDTLRPTSVTSVFENRNWGWGPYIDENGLVHHKDSETVGNPYMIGETVLPGKDWHELSIGDKWRLAVCPYPVCSGPARETGYLRFIDVDPTSLDWI